jgi:oxygen-dependent protoporphyrinogen oxidase
MKVTVIGGGISGLATAYNLEKLAAKEGFNLKLTLIEAAPNLGGKIKTVAENGFLCESGPAGFLDNKPETLNLCQSLMLTNDLVRANDTAAKRFIFLDGKLQKIPEKPPEFLSTKLISWPAKLRALKELWTKPMLASKDETIAEFAQRHLGKEITQKLISAMVVGIFAGDAEKLSLISSFPVMAALEKEGNGSLIRAMLRRQKAKKSQQKEATKGPKSEGLVGSSGKLTTFKSGMAQAIEAIKSQLKAEVVTGKKVVGIDKQNDGYQVYFANDEQPLFSQLVVLATPAYEAAAILSSLSQDLALNLSKIPYVPVNVVVTGYQKQKFGVEVDGFGFLVPKKEKRKILGSLWTSSIFPNQTPKDYVALRTMVGGAISPELTELDDEQTVDTVNKELYEIMGIKAEPEFVKVFRHEKAIPQYVVGHSQTLAEIDKQLQKLPGLYLTGNAYRGIGFNDCIANAKTVAEQVFAFAASVTPVK